MSEFYRAILSAITKTVHVLDETLLVVKQTKVTLTLFICSKLHLFIMHKNV